MRSQQRTEYLIQTAIKDGFVSISDAALQLDVSIETIRRDINLLDQEGKLRKVRGGAEPIHRYLRKDLPLAMRIYHNEDEKNRVGYTAAQLIRDNSIVGLDGGASIQIMASYITGVQNVTFITNSLPIAAILEKKLFNKEITGRLFFIGGEMDIESQYSKGALAIEALKAYNFDQCFLSCSALSTYGVSDYSTEGSAFSGYMVVHSLQSILLAEQDKLGKNSLHKYAEITDFDSIVLGDPSSVPTEIKKALEKSGTRLIFAS